MLDLPTELTINILSYLPFNSLSRLQSVCKFWSGFCILHESTIYRNAACLHTFIPRPTTILNELSSLYSLRVLEDVKTWKDLCRKRIQIQRNWKGKGPSIITEHKATSSSYMVYKIKVDEQAGFIIMTYEKGGLRVKDLNEDRILWFLPQWYVRRYAHLEYGQGYVIFNRDNGDMEVWRRASGIPEHDVDESSAPDASQREVYGLPTTRGYFQPWAVLHMPEPTSVFRFVYPTLIAASFDRAYLWDIPSGKLIQTIKECQSIVSEDGSNHYLLEIMYVEISERHVFMAGHYLRVFSRETGKSVWNFSSSSPGYGLWRYMPTISHDKTPGSVLVGYEIESTQEPYEFKSEESILDDEFVAVHVSACGCHFAALLGRRLLVVYDFEKASNEEELYGQTLDIMIMDGIYDSHEESFNMAFDYGRISVVTGSGIFIVEVDESSLGNISNEAPILTICRIYQFLLTGEESSDEVSCLMMSDTGLYFNWIHNELIADEEEEEFEPMLEDDDTLEDGYIAALPNIDQQPIPRSSSVFSINFARS